MATIDNNNCGKSISVAKLVNKMDLKVFTDNINLREKRIYRTDVNRPALQLTGYYDHFGEGRMQLIGMVEFAFLQPFSAEKKEEIYKTFLSHDIPAVVFCRGFTPDEQFVKIAEENGIPVLGAEQATSEVIAETIGILSEALAPSITVHGVLVDVYGEGILLIGESGIGKSEAALELIRRGHRLVSDDAVVIKKIDGHTLMGSSPAVTRNLIELRGIGIIDVKSLYGVECIKLKQQIDLVIKLEEWSKDKTYDRVGLEDEYIDFLGVNVVCNSLPIRPGRNLAVICETAAVNNRQKKMGYNAAEELYRRVQANMTRGNDEEDDDYEA